MLDTFAYPDVRKWVLIISYLGILGNALKSISIRVCPKGMDENAQQISFHVIPAKAGIQFLEHHFSGFQPSLE